jgi:hypothetical protein
VNIKLQTGLKRLSEAGDNPSLLGSALVSIHGALEDHFRALLTNNRSLTATQRLAVADRQKTQWVQLLDLLEQYENLPPSERKAILRFNNLRQGFAHGDEFEGSANEVEEYAAYVQNVVEGSSSKLTTTQGSTTLQSLGKILCPCGSSCRGASPFSGPPVCYQSFSGDSMPSRFARREIEKEKGLGGKLLVSFGLGLIEAFAKVIYEAYQCPVCGCEVLFARHQSSKGSNVTRVNDTANC